MKNVLEKILKEIEEKFKTADAEKCDCEELCDVEDWYDSGYIDGQLSAHEKCMDIIRSHMDEAKDTNAPSNASWIPVEEKLPEDGELVKVTVHSSEWIGDFNSNWVPEEDRIYHQEEYHVYDGYLSKNGIWNFYDEEYSKIACEKEFGTDKGCLYDVVTAWMPIELPEPYKGE